MNINKRDINYIKHKIKWLRGNAKELKKADENIKLIYNVEGDLFKDLSLDITCMCDCIEGKLKEIRRRK